MNRVKKLIVSKEPIFKQEGRLSEKNGFVMVQNMSIPEHFDDLKSMGKPIEFLEFDRLFSPVIGLI